MPEAESKVNLKNRQTIVRTIHNAEKPFVQLDKKTLWDERLSLKAVGLWSRCMSRPNNWKLYISQLAESCKEGRTAIDSAIKELIEAGYVLRMDYKIRGKNGRYSDSGVEYIVFEYPATEEEIAEQVKILKQSLQDSGFLNSGNLDSGHLDSGNLQLLIKTYTKTDCTKKDNTPPIPPNPKPDLPKRANEQSASADGVGVSDSSKVKKKKEPPIFSDMVKEVAAKMLVILQKYNPVYRPPEDLTKFHEHVSLMLETDRQKPADVLKAFEWACQDNELRDTFKGWQSIVCTNKRKGKPSTPAEIFRGHFSTIYSQMTSRAPRKFAPCSNDAAARETIRRAEERAI